MFWTYITPQQIGKSEDLFLYCFSLEAYRVKLKNTNYNHFRLWCRNVTELIQTENMFYFYLQFLYSFPEVNLKVRFLFCSYLETITEVVSPPKCVFTFIKICPQGRYVITQGLEIISCKTPNVATRKELGRLTTKLFVEIAIIKFRIYLQSLPENDIAKQCLQFSQ